MGYISFMMPAPQGSSWITVYRDAAKGDIGLILSASRNSPGEEALKAVVADWSTFGPALGGTARVIDAPKYHRQKVGDVRKVGDLRDAEARRVAFEWLARHIRRDGAGWVASVA